jgi:hypothetical protein
MFATVLQQCLRSTSMEVPKILPWLANRAGISEDLALKLWRCAARETAMLIADCDSSDYYGRTIARLLDGLNAWHQREIDNYREMQRTHPLSCQL